MSCIKVTLCAKYKLPWELSSRITGTSAINVDVEREHPGPRQNLLHGGAHLCLSAG